MVLSDSILQGISFSNWVGKVGKDVMKPSTRNILLMLFFLVVQGSRACSGCWIVMVWDFIFYFSLLLLRDAPWLSG